jgi:hypothetical protein
MTRLPKGLHLLLLVVLWLGVAPALADEIADESAVTLTTARVEPEPVPDATGDFEIAKADWGDRRHWHYGTSHLFGLTRGMEDAGVPRLARPFLYVFTVPFDTVHLPIAVISGLFGG